MNEIKRHGYGSAFNFLYVQDNLLYKKAKNDYGKKKLQTEILAYKKFTELCKSFPLARYIRHTPDTLILQYYPSYRPLSKFYEGMTKEKKINIVQKIQSALQSLHLIEKVSISKEEYTRLLRMEVIDKLEERYKQVETTLQLYPFLSVNGVVCLSFSDCLKRLEMYMNDFVNKQSVFELSYIHGDPQFNNILYDSNSDSILFIDPRGYFGDSHLYGIAEYDWAKLLFALSGYDKFDETDKFVINIQEQNISIPDFIVDSNYEVLYPELRFLLISIWLGNCHCFLSEPSKLLVSHAFARFLATKFLVNSEN
jgi:hypothetical protein